MNPGGRNEIRIYFDGVKEGEILDESYNYRKLEISGLDYGTNTTVTIEAHNGWNDLGTLKIDYVRTNITQPVPGTFQLVDKGGV
jgi:hypothetical protein